MAEVKVYEAEWNQLSPASQDRIREIMESNGLLKAGDGIVPDANAPTAAAVMSARNALNIAIPQPLCKSLCDVGEAAAHAACGLLPNPAEQAVCNAVATAAANVCRDACK